MFIADFDEATSFDISTIRCYSSQMQKPTTKTVSKAGFAFLFQLSTQGKPSGRHLPRAMPCLCPVLVMMVQARSSHEPPDCFHLQ